MGIKLPFNKLGITTAGLVVLATLSACDSNVIIDSTDNSMNDLASTHRAELLCLNNENSTVSAPSSDTQSSPTIEFLTMPLDEGESITTQNDLFITADQKNPKISITADFGDINAQDFYRSTTVKANAPSSIVNIGTIYSPNDFCAFSGLGMTVQEIPGHSGYFEVREPSGHLEVGPITGINNILVSAYSIHFAQNTGGDSIINAPYVTVNRDVDPGTIFENLKDGVTVNGTKLACSATFKALAADSGVQATHLNFNDYVYQIPNDGQTHTAAEISSWNCTPDAEFITSVKPFPM